MTQDDKVVNTQQKPVTIEYVDLIDESKRLQVLAWIEEAFGNHPTALGIILIKDIPHYENLRQTLLPMASKLARLPQSELEELEDPESSYMFGWSHGKEIMKSDGRPDFAKGSFYANPVQVEQELRDLDPEIVQRYPEYCHPNLWPQSLPQLKPAMLDLCNSMLRVAGEVAILCDQFLSKQILKQQSQSRCSLQSIVGNTKCLKARLLHYFPQSDQSSTCKSSALNDDLCGWHVDHSCLTVLTAPMIMKDVSSTSFLRDCTSNTCNDSNDDGQEIELKGQFGGGLHIRNRDNQIVRVQIPTNCMAIQTGEALEIMSDGTLRATPHCVSNLQVPPSCELSRDNLVRNTLALFIQPDWTQELRQGLSFAEYTQSVLKQHYK
ncbi:hypothetical protein MP228_012089 [Amoeboaphelidium protococcarum]|nr:hypothetical protein MP228_012089 [Amoeboaphelidium protococcarum]